MKFATTFLCVLVAALPRMMVCRLHSDFQLISRLRLQLKFMLLFQHGAPDVRVQQVKIWRAWRPLILLSKPVRVQPALRDAQVLRIGDYLGWNSIIFLSFLPCTMRSIYARSCCRNSVCPSVRLSVRLPNACIVTKRDNCLWIYEHHTTCLLYTSELPTIYSV